jgi:hypothetical protein
VLEHSARYGILLRGFFDTEMESADHQIQLKQPYPVFPLSKLTIMLRQHVIAELIFGVGSDKIAELEDIFLLCDGEGVRTRVAVDFFPHVHSEVYLERLGITPLLTFSAAPHDEIRLLAKRVIDMTIATSDLYPLNPTDDCCCRSD